MCANFITFWEEKILDPFVSAPPISSSTSYRTYVRGEGSTAMDSCYQDH